MAEEAERVLVIFEDMVEAEEHKQKEMNEQFAFSEYCYKKTREMEIVKSKKIFSCYNRRLIFCSNFLCCPLSFKKNSKKIITKNYQWRRKKWKIR